MTYTRTLLAWVCKPCPSWTISAILCPCFYCPFGTDQDEAKYAGYALVGCMCVCFPFFIWAYLFGILWGLLFDFFTIFCWAITCGCGFKCCVWNKCWRSTEEGFVELGSPQEICGMAWRDMN